MQELFSSFAARWARNGPSHSSLSHFCPSSHKEILDMEIQFLHENFTEKDFRSLMDHIQSMASGEAPFFATTLSLVYGGLIRKAFSKHAPLGSGLGGQSVATPTCENGGLRRDWAVRVRPGSRHGKVVVVTRESRPNSVRVVPVSSTSSSTIYTRYCSP